MAKVKAKGKDVVVLSGGLPNEVLFPISDDIHFKVNPVSGAEKKVTVNLDKVSDLNYNGQTFSKGSLQLLGSARKLLVENNHNLPTDFYNTYNICLSSGSTDAMTKSLILLTDPKDTVFAGEFSYTGIRASAEPLCRTLTGVEMDSEGMIPESLRTMCRQSISKGERPRLVYIIPNGQNPMSISWSSKRKREIYSVCSEFDLILLVDDPYVMLSYEDEQEKTCTFLEIDSEHRVVRLDSFSKIIAPGFRLGVVTAPNVYIDKFTQYAQVSFWGMSGPSQLILNGILQNLDFPNYIKNLRSVYKVKRDLLVNKLKQILAGYVEFSIPTHGMFLWVELKGVEDTKQLQEILLEKNVSFMSGGVFAVDNGRKCNAMRISFSYATEDHMEKGLTVLKETLVEMGL